MARVHHHICVWPDGTFCDPDELHEMTHMSDDYAKVAVGDDEEDEAAAMRHVRAENAYWRSL